MIEIKRLKDCTIEEAVKAWNLGFEGYYFNMTTTPDQFVNRMVADGLSPSISIVAFKDGEPVGLILNGVREINGKKVSWNGGTGVAQSVRGQKIGQLLMEETLKIYKEEGVDIATLEAIYENERAINLYKKMGYEVVDELIHLKLDGSVHVDIPTIEKYTTERILPQYIPSLSFYKRLNPWQTQWQAVKEGEAVVAKDAEGEIVGYAYFKRMFTPEGKHIATVMSQCEAKPGHEDGENIILYLTNYVFDGFKDDIRRVVPIIPIKESALTHQTFEKKLGFNPYAKQVYMMKYLSEK